MPLRKLLYIHICLLLILIADLVLASVTGYTIIPSIVLSIIFGFLASVLACLFRAGAIYNALKAHIGYNAKLVLSLAGICCFEVAVTLSTALMGFALLWQSGSKTIANGAGYEVRSVPALTWPPRYVLYETPFMLERRVGDVHANEEDFSMQGEVKGVQYAGDSVWVTVQLQNSDTSVVFYTR